MDNCLADRHWKEILMSKTLVIGYGNPLRGDDGLGWRVAERLAERLPADQVEILTCQQLTPELAATLSRASFVLFIDASVQEPPGTFRLQSVQPAQLTPTTFSHHLTPGQLLTLSQQLYAAAPAAQLLSVGGLEFGAQEQLSASVAALLPHLLDLCQQVLSTQFHAGATLA